MNASSGSGLWPMRISMRSPLRWLGEPDSMTVTTPAPRDKILQAALQVFAEKGYHRALVDDIVRVSGTSKGAVYHHFPNKEALFLALVDDFAGRLAEAVAAAIGGAEGALGKVEAALTAGLETFARHRELAQILLLESVSLGPAYQ